MIYTLTLNPSIDYVLRLDALTLGTVNRTIEDFSFPGGKGINVSRILSRLAIPNTALGFIGGYTGPFIEQALQAEKIQTDFILIAQNSRINVKIKAESETEINAQGPQIQAQEVVSLKKQLQKLSSEDMIVLAGSYPTSLGAYFYNEIIELLTEQKVPFVIDTTGENLKAALAAHPFLVKPNKDELADLFQVQISNKEEVLPYAQRLLEAGAQNVLVSMAGEGALCLTANHIYFAPPLQDQVKNSVGAGDSMIAGFIGGYTQTKDILSAFKLGVACGSATAFSDDLASKEKIEACLANICIETWK